MSADKAVFYAKVFFLHMLHRGGEMDGQDITPEILLALGDILGDGAARGLPFNIQNLLGNWLMLIGQVLITFNAQQQYMENGPGQYYDLCHKNSGNLSPGYQENKSSRSDDLARRLEELEERLAHLEEILAPLCRYYNSER